MPRRFQGSVYANHGTRRPVAQGIIGTANGGRPSIYIHGAHLLHDGMERLAALPRG
ncbi:hypothetical protein MESS2_1690002 [Mesorhizobium metallidurans STM 2683]|uniref:Uncharacterized protein n=1 Tax=Mesorhizobium metallidurans STM 2683 TaxID=1297569 RepID=M5F245_9HYPH|nr:hypothetical protein MESS2_1690002 [Mesorhizobium metallidurans STM 2683]